MTKFCACGCGKEIKEKSTWASGHNPNKRKSKLDAFDIIGEYEQLGSLEKVAELHNCTIQAIHYHLNKKGYQRHKIDWSNLLDDYNELKTTKAVAAKYGCSHETVSAKLYELFGVRCGHDNKLLDGEVGIGRYGELIALQVLKGSKDMNKDNIRSPYDIEWNGMKIDVKTSRLHVRGKRTTYDFETNNSGCDAYVFVFLDENDIPLKVTLIPSEKFKTKKFTIEPKNTNKLNNYTLEVKAHELIGIFQRARKTR